MAAKKPARRVTHAQAPTPYDKNMSVAHHKDSVVFNKAHALRHIQEAEIHARKLKTASKKAAVKPAVVNSELRKLAALKKRAGGR